MEIIVSKVFDKYAFSTGEFLDGSFCTVFSSISDAYLVDGLKSTYDYSGEAHLAAQKLLKYVPSLFIAKKAQNDNREVSLSAKDFVLQHFGTQLEILTDRFLESEGASKSEEDHLKILNALVKEVGIVSEGVKGLLSDIGDEDDNLLLDIKKELGILKKNIEKEINSIASPKEKIVRASKTTNNFDFEDVLISFGEKILSGIKHLDDTIFLKEITSEEDDCQDAGYRITFANKDGDFVDTCFNKDFLLTEIIPYDSKKYPTYSKKFFENLFEPIVYSLGHYYDTERQLVVCPFYGDNERNKLSAYHIGDKKMASYDISFSEDADKVSWWVNRPDSTEASKKIPDIVAASSHDGHSGTTKYDKLLGTEVKFVNKEISSLYNRTGKIMDYRIQEPNFVLFDVDFRRGLGIVTVKQEDILP